MSYSENSTKTVIVGMSGGVDSSVSALLLKQQGYNVIGMFMKNWEEEDAEHCPAAQDYNDVVRVCETLGIPYYSVNFAKEYWENVFSHFIEEYKQGYTPNPDILCNREIKFKVFLEKALQLGADYLATGHYCQNIFKNDKYHLCKGLDANKDQTYFLYTIQQAQLQKVLFPIGGLQKSEVRELARIHGLATSEKKDSVGICFIGKRDFKTFLSKYVSSTPGNFETLDGKIIGRHDGIAYYTIGQRKGLGIGGPGEAWFVVGKDPARNVVFIEQGENHPALYSQGLIATEISWVDSPPAQLPYVCQAKTRYRQEACECVITHIEKGEIQVIFTEPHKAITPRQSIVFYQGEICLGGAIIKEAIKAL